MPLASGPLTARRILVYGATGAGKSTAARQIATLLHLPCILADDLAWEPGWVSVPTEEQRRRIALATARDEWVLDTAYSTWKEIPLERAQLIIGLDYPRLLSLRRLIIRTVRRLLTRERVCNGNIESLRMAFSRQSIILWHFHSFSRKQARMRQWADAPVGPPVMLFRHPRELETWLDGLRQTRPTRPSG